MLILLQFYFLTAKLEETSDKSTLDKDNQYYATLKQIPGDKVVPSRSRFMVQDLLDLRDSK